jgi:hypothetical protein
MSASIDLNDLAGLVDLVLNATTETKPTITLSMAFATFCFYLFIGEFTSGTELETTAASKAILISAEVSK